MGAFTEELFPPIHSSVFTVTACSILAAKKGYPSVLWIAAWSALGKNAGSIIVYILADEAEDVVVEKYGKYLGIKRHFIKTVGRR